MPKIDDPEFGPITLRRNKLSRNIRLKIDARGLLSISLPKRAPIFLARQLVNDSRPSIRTSLAKIKRQRRAYQHGDVIGKAHRLAIVIDDNRAHQSKLQQQELIVYASATDTSSTLQPAVHQGVAKALRVQARAYLPYRLESLAAQHGFRYTKLRFSSAGTRWGSCSSEGTISLNIWLMKLPFELIDYVILHELCHTAHMNHSQAFWDLLHDLVPTYKDFRLQLKQHHPYA